MTPEDWRLYAAAVYTGLAIGGTILLAALGLVAIICWRIKFLPGFGQHGPCGMTTMTHTPPKEPE